MEEEIKIFEIIKYIKKHIKFLLFSVLIGIVIGSTVYFLLPKKYSTQISFVPEILDSNNFLLNRFGSFLPSGVKNSNKLSEFDLYEKVINSDIFIYNLFLTSVKYKNQDKLLKELIVKDTFSFSKKNKSNNFFKITERESRYIRAFKEKIKINEQNINIGLGRIKVVDNDPILAYILVNLVFKNLEENLLEIKVKNSKDNYNYLNKIVIDKEEKLKKSIENLVKFESENQNISSVSIKYKLKMLKSEVDINRSVFIETVNLSQKVLSETKNNIPVFTIIEPAFIPVRHSFPRLRIVIFTTLLSLSLATLYLYWKFVANREKRK